MSFILPFFLVFGVFGLATILYTGWVSLFNWNPIGKQQFIGLDNYFHLWVRPAVLDRDLQHHRHLVPVHGAPAVPGAGPRRGPEQRFAAVQDAASG